MRVRNGAYNFPRRGFLELDLIAGIAILAALTLALAAVLGRQHRATEKLADTRAAAQVAEAALADLRAGKPPQTAGGDDDTSVEVRSEGSAGQDKWVRVSVTVRGGRASVVGLVPADAALPAGGAP